MAELVFALDLAARTGYAVGRADNPPPRSGAVQLKKPGESPSVAFGNLIAWLAECWGDEKPDIVVKEAPLQLQGFKNSFNAQATVRMTHGLHAIVEGMGRRFGVKVYEVHDATIRKHFIGKGRMGSREETKRAVIKRAQVLGYMPRGLNDSDRADACAVWDYGTASIPKKLFLFGEEAA